MAWGERGRPAWLSRADDNVVRSCGTRGAWAAASRRLGCRPCAAVHEQRPRAPAACAPERPASSAQCDRHNGAADAGPRASDEVHSGGGGCGACTEARGPGGGGALATERRGAGRRAPAGREELAAGAEAARVGPVDVGARLRATWRD